MPREKLPLWGKVILVCLSVWALVVILPDFARVFDQDFNKKLPFEADNDGALTEVGPGSPLAGCQTIDLKRNYCEGRMADLLAVFGGMGGMQYVWYHLDKVSLYFHCTGPSPQTAATPIVHPYAPLHFLCTQSAEPDNATSQLRTVPTGPGELSFAARVALLLAQSSAVLFIALAFWLVWSRPSAATWGFFLYAIWFNPGQYYVFYALLQHWSPTVLLAQEVAQAVFQAIGYCGFVLFALRFPQNDIAPQWRHVEQALPLIGGGVLFVQLYAFLAVFGIRAEWAVDTTFYSGLLIDALVLAVLFIRYRQQRHEDRHRLRYIFWCSVFGLAAFIAAEIDVATTLLGVRLPEFVIYFLYSLNASVAVAVWHAVRKYRVVDVKFTLSRHLIRGVLWILVAVPLIALTQVTDAYSETMVRQYVDHPDLFINILLWLVLAAPIKYCVDFVQERAVTLFDSVFFRKLQRAEDVIGKVIDQLAHADELPDVEEQISLRLIVHDLVAVPVESMELASAALFQRHDSNIYRLAYARDWPNKAADALDSQHEIIRGFQTDRRSSLRFDPSALPPDLPSGAAAPALAVPIRCAGRIEAVVFYGAHRGGDDLNDDEVGMLERLAVAASGAYKTLLIASSGRIGSLDGGLQEVPAS